MTSNSNGTLMPAGNSTENSVRLPTECIKKILSLLDIDDQSHLSTYEGPLQDLARDILWRDVTWAMVVKEASAITRQFVLGHGYGSSQDERAESTAVIPLSEWQSLIALTHRIRHLHEAERAAWGAIDPLSSKIVQSSSPAYPLFQNLTSFHGSIDSVVFRLGILGENIQVLRLSVPPGIDSYGMGDVLPHAVANFKSLTTLTLTIHAGDTLHPKFIDTVLDIIPNIPNLKVLGLPSSALNGNILLELNVRCRQLQELHSTYILPQFGVSDVQDDSFPWPESLPCSFLMPALAKVSIVSTCKPLGRFLESQMVFSSAIRHLEFRHIRGVDNDILDMRDLIATIASQCGTLESFVLNAHANVKQLEADVMDGHHRLVLEDLRRLSLLPTLTRLYIYDSYPVEFDDGTVLSLTHFFRGLTHLHLNPCPPCPKGTRPGLAAVKHCVGELRDLEELALCLSIKGLQLLDIPTLPFDWSSQRRCQHLQLLHLGSTQFPGGYGTSAMDRTCALFLARVLPMCTSIRIGDIEEGEWQAPQADEEWDESVLNRGWWNDHCKPLVQSMRMMYVEGLDEGRLGMQRGWSAL